jgi:hypothetical protein
MSIRRSLSLAGILALAGSATAQTDSFHIMQIQGVIGGVNGDTTQQAVQLRQRSSFQNQVQLGILKAWDATGSNPVILIHPGTSVPNFNLGDTILFTTAAFDTSTTPACVPDFHMNPIPASYLPAGRLTWEDTFGTILWSLAWGGAAYTGSNMGSLTNSTTGNFGPQWPTPLPTGTQGLFLTISASATAGSNSTDYALTSGPAVFTNNAHTNFTINAAAPCYPNCDNSTIPPILNVLDFSCFLNKFAAGDTYANCDNSTTDPILNVLDFSCFLNRFAAGCS